MGTTRRMFVANFAAVIAAVIGGAGLNSANGTSALAADEDPLVAKVTALETAVAEHVSAKASDALKDDITTAAGLYKENAKKDPLRERILKILGGLAKNRADDVAKAAILAIGETKDTAGAKYIRGFFHALDDKTTESVALAASFEAAKKIPDDSLVDPLLSIVDDSKNIPVAVKAMDTLSKFGGLKHSREKILDALAKSVAKSKTGRKGYGAGAGGGGVGDATGSGGSSGSPTGTGQAGPADRWNALSAELPKTLNTLTGQREASADSWFDRIKQNKNSLGALFVYPPTDEK
jgi:hypothetical protein